MKRLIVSLLAISMLFALYACNKSSDSGGVVEITVAFESAPNGLDPLSEDSVECKSIGYMIYDRLAWVDTTNTPQPAVAKSWEQTGARSYNFEINMDYTFSNGDKITMDDIVFSINRMKEVPKSASTGALVESVSYNGNTLTINLNTENRAAFTRVVAMAVIFNKKYVEENGEDALFRNPVGTGPYKVTEFTPGAGVTIEVRDDYPFTKPQITKINYVGISEVSSRYIALETGQIQYAWGLNAPEYNLALDNDKLDTYFAGGNRAMPIYFNCERPPLDDVNVRRGLVHALDIDSYCALQGGRPKATGMLFASYPDFYTESANLPEFNMDRARELLEAAGISPANPVTFELICFMGDPGLEMYQSALRTLGVELQINIQEISVYIANDAQGNFDMCWTVQVNRDYHMLNDLDRFDVNTIGSRNLCRYYNPRVQELIPLMQVEADAARLREMAVEVNDILSQEVPGVFILLLPIYSAMAKGLSGVEIESTNQTYFRSATYNP